jgi:hypothetical protein
VGVKVFRWKSRGIALEPLLTTGSGLARLGRDRFYRLA